SSRRRHTRSKRDWSSDVCSSDLITYWTEEYKVDGFRFDMMGDHDAETIQIAYDEASALNPNILMIGEGWETYEGDEGDSVQPARSEERRVGKECRSRWTEGHEKK